MFDLSCFCQEAISLPHRPLTLSCAMNGRLAPLWYSSTPNSLSEFLGHSSSGHRLIRIVVSGPHSGLFTRLKPIVAWNFNSFAKQLNGVKCWYGLNFRLHHCHSYSTIITLHEFLFFLGNITVPSFIYTHSTLGNSSLSNPSTVLQEDCYSFVHVVVGTHHSLSLTYPPLLCCHLGLLSLQLWLFLC